MGLWDALRNSAGGLGGKSHRDTVSDGEESRDLDLQVLVQLSKNGANLAKPTHTLFYIYAPSEEAASRIASAITDPQLQTEVRPAALGEAWLTLVQGQLVPELETLRRYRVQFEALAAAEGGEYDGWEAAVSK